MADKKISQLTAASTPLAGTEILPIVQANATVKVANNDLRPRQIQSNATSGILQIVGPTASATRVMTTPDANFTVARTDAGQTFTGDQIINGTLTTAYVAKQISYANGDATPSVSNASLMLVANSSPTSITNFDDGVVGQIIVLKFEDSNTTITRDNAYLAGGTNFTSTAHDTLTLIKLGSFWFEVCRSVNS